jgi:predicted MPP superfamily phosphohydrolase
MPILYLLVMATGISNAGWWKWADRRLKKQRRSTVWRSVLAFFVASQLLYLIYFTVAPYSARRVRSWIPIPFVATVYIWNLLILPATMISIGVGQVAAALKRITIDRVRHPSPLELDARLLSRRQALAAVAVAAPPLVTAIAVGRAMPQLDDFRIRSLELGIAGLPPNLDGLRIAHLSDIHVGRYTRRGTLPKIVEATNRLKADLVLYTGDLIDLSLADLDRGIDTLKQIDPRFGFAMIEGNHDLIENADEFDRRTKAAGLPLLIDETTTFLVRGERIQILGSRWGFATGDRRRAGEAAFAQSVQRLMQQRQPDAFGILLAHHPHTFDAAAAAGLPLTLSGHTHGGQLMLSDNIGFGPLMFRYWSGVYRKGANQLVVNNGVGNWFPLRTNAPAEIIDLTLRAI